MHPQTPIIGLDPGVTTGFAVWFHDLHEFTRLEALTPSQVVRELDRMAGPHRPPFVVIEDARRLPRYSKRRAASGEAAVAVGRSIGYADAYAALFEQACIEAGLPYRLQTPYDHAPHLCGKDGKISAEGFRLVTRYEGSTNQHKRDAGMMAFLSPRPERIQP